MKKKLTTLLFGLLLAVGWTSNASAQALPEGGFTKSIGLPNVGAQVSDNAPILKKKATAFDQSITNMVMGQANVKGPVQAKALPLPKRTMASAPKRVADTGPNSVVHNKAYYQQFKYSYTDDNGTVHNDVDPTEEAKDPNQIYELLRWVYGNPNFPGPKYSAYTPAYVQEDPVVYGPIAGGWNITAAGSGASGDDITITASNYYASIASIKIYNADNDQLIVNWDAATEVNAGNYQNTTNGNYFVLPTNWTTTINGTTNATGFGAYNFGTDDAPVYVGYFISGESLAGTLTIPYSALNGATNVRVVINAATDDNTTSTLQVNGGTTASMTTTLTDYTWTLQVAEEHDPNAFVQGTVQAPYEDGYTALMVSLYNDTTKIYPENMNRYDGSWQYTQKSDLINYIRDNIQSVKLLTDGMRIGSRDDHTIGTVFSCDGTYNRFFLLGKGQARKKAPQLQTNINNGSWPEYCGEEGPFKTMFEQFSPTTGNVGADITNFYSKLMEGNVYNVVHDCASVIQNKHQFSMSGKKGTQAIALTGLNFFIPDYRLLWWSLDRNVNYYNITVDGRDMNPYVATNTTTGAHGTTNYYNYATSIPYFAAWFAQYNQQFAPKMGIYKITLDATATQVAQLYAPGNKNYQVTLTWVSSLNEMSGHEVPQTYTVWYFDENGERQYVVAEGITDGQTGLTKITYLVEQFEHSYTIDYIVEGSPDDTEHPQFIAVSNIDGVVIPGWNDFVGLELDHHESDFVVADMANWYRNFLSVVNEDLYNGLTVSAVTGANGNTPMNKFSLYRYNYNGTKASGAETKVADIELFNATPDQVSYRVTYDDDASDADMEDQQVLEAKYQREAMGLKDEGVIRVKGNGDLVIWPNNYYVNFKSITVKDGTQTVASWNAATMNKLPNGWETSPGSKWEEFTHNGVKVGYMEGGGYIYIPNMLNRYSNLSVDIEAFGEGANVKRITVNDKTQDITATAAGTTYTWTSLSPNALHAPKMATESHEYSYTFTNNPFSVNGGNVTLGDITWNSVLSWSNNSSNATALNYDDARGAQIGSRKYPLTSFVLSTSAIPGTIKSIKVGANAYADNTSSTENRGKISVTIGGQAFGTTQTLSNNTTSSGINTFEGSASGNIVITMTNGTTSNTRRAMYIKSIEITYEVEGEDTPTEGGLLRMHMLLVDQFKQEIPADNSHPDAYGYVLRYEPNGPNGDGKKQSGTVKVDIEKTDAQPNGYYTVAQIDNDQNLDTALLTMDILDAQVKMNLNDENPNVLYFQMQGAGKNAIPDTYLTQLQYMKNVRKYEEMLEGSAHKGEQYDADEVHYYFNDATPEVGSYTAGDYKAYAPSVSTWGIDRRYFEADGLNNTYGAPVWKTAVGQVTVGNNCVAQLQVGTNGQPNPATTWTVDGQTYGLYFLSATAQGYLPNYPAVTNIEYEPYMFRVFVEGDNLRKFVQSEDGTHLVDAGAITGKYCVGSFDINSKTWSANNLSFAKGISNVKPSETNPGWEGNMMFGAPVNMSTNDLKVYVRFYYMVKGWNASGMTLRAGEGGARPGNGAEGEGGAGISTGVYDLHYQSEIVDQTFFNSLGMQSDKPFSGINIVVTRYSDGTTRTTKVIR